MSSPYLTLWIYLLFFFILQGNNQSKSNIKEQQNETYIQTKHYKQIS